jgi:hypothetical protein
MPALHVGLTHRAAAGQSALAQQPELVQQPDKRERHGRSHVTHPKLAETPNFRL